MADVCPYCQGTGRIVASLSTRLTTLRTDRALTQDEVANAAGISRPQIANLERGRGEPSIPTLMRLAAFFHVSTDYLLGITEGPDNG